MAIKRAIDVVFAVFLLLVLSPIFVIAGVGVALSSPGPVFYLGKRTGLHGQHFRIFKFRTMVVGAELKGGGTTALGDTRIFPFGQYLRRFKLDELPQLINVLRGEMSLVGPRPELPRYTDKYDDRERVILSVRPGITDLSSIRFSSLDEIVGAEDADRVFEEKVLPEKNRLRILYVETQSLLGDFRIMFMTACCVLRKLFR
jgi:lipopolysaccharide/colanic/teichoic acid biosynthesis glycosyltransferase